MEATQVPVNVRNPAEPHRTWEALFLADTGPRLHLEAICVRARGQRAHELGAGSEIKPGITASEIEFMCGIGGAIILGQSAAEPLLGVTAVEPVGIEVDPTNQRLKRLPAVSLKIDVVLPNSDSDDTGAQIHV